MIKFKIISLILFCSALLSVSGCDKNLAGYNLKKADKVLVLPDTLREISGITVIDSSTVACIQDENGILFLYDVVHNKIKAQYNFHLDGDYEGITLVRSTMYVLRSDGVLFEITNYNTPGFKVKTHATGIPAANNEGLCYDEDNNRLLIACKSKLGKGPELKDKRTIYGFNLATNKLSSQPVYSFDVSNIKMFADDRNVDLPVKTNKKGTVSRAQLKFFTSAICIHPVTKKLYVLSAVDHMLFIFNEKGKPEHIEKLDAAVFNKAEGITFLGNGDMFISNEALGKKPTLLRFNYRRQ